ncbi:pyridoxamine 5'-phosphate oxidase family protein [Streptomyces sp. NPDC059853]|uniref:pyridoxamine 5'-phosphate oxidase family protein n=1 Tax=Streptomyces sp. NPDC059853 TaxID=3346973 RepID=UPI0036476D46
MTGTSPRAAPRTTLDERYSSPGARAMPWHEAWQALERAELYWLSTVRPDHRPHVTPVLAVAHAGALYFTTGEQERKGRNLAANPACVLTTGRNTVAEGTDLVVEGRAGRITGEALLRAVAEAFLAKYGPDWRLTVDDGHLVLPTGPRAIAFEVRPETAFGFRKGVYGQTRWRF